MEEQRERVREFDRNRAVIGFHLHAVNFHHLGLVINLIWSIKKSHFQLHYRLAYIIALVIYIFRPLPFFSPSDLNQSSRLKKPAEISVYVGMCILMENRYCIIVSVKLSFNIVYCLFSYILFCSAVLV